ncbi:MAG: hypothetical protein NE334_12515 [Lentisphaeraceae bacterium]|nr:hypothetical protein [Lentisphaeraceae bacterium]
MLPVDLLDYADEILAKDEVSRAEIRAAISKSYYAVFLLVRDHFKITTKVAVHDEVLDKLKSLKISLSRDLYSGKKTRQRADYQITESDDTLLFDGLEAHVFGMRNLFDEIEELIKDS